MTTGTVSTRALKDSRRSVQHYDESARQIADLYESTTFERVHEGSLDLLPASGSAVLDVGAGSGRDAAALATRGYCVTAVEPSRGLREEAHRRHGDEQIKWCDDALPHLRTLGDQRFAFILVSAVWMHLIPRDRSTAMHRLAQLLAPSGRLVISVREGLVDPARAITAVTTQEVEETATRSGLLMVRRIDAADTLSRADVSWSTLVFEKPQR